MTTGTSTSNLTHAQSLIWAGQQLFPDRPLYNMALAFRIHGPVDEATFRQAFSALVEQTDVLRTTVTASDGNPRRIVGDSLDADLEVVDLTGEPDAAARARDLVADRASRPFDLEERLWRSGLIEVDHDETIWWIVQHHLITDGWAVAILYRRMSDLYMAFADGEPPDGDVPQFEHYASFEERVRGSDEHEAVRDHWREADDTSTVPTSFYGAGPVPGGSTRTDRVTRTLGIERSERLESLLTERAGGSLLAGMGRFAAFAAIVAALLARVGGQTDLTILTPAANRPSKRFKETVGLFIEVLPLRVSVTADDTFADLLDRCADGLQDLLLHARPATSSAARNRASSVLLNVINASFGPFAGHPMTSDWVHPGHGDPDHALRLQVHDLDDSGDWTLHFDLNRDVFDATREAALIGQFETLLDAMLADPGRRIADVDLRSPHEVEASDTWNDTTAELPFSTVLEGIRRQLAARPDDAAVVDGGVATTYGDLADRVERLARHLVAAAGERPRVGIHLPRSADLVVAAVASLATGGAYVPIDRTLPAERVGAVLVDGEVDVVVTDDPAAFSNHGVPVLGARPPEPAPPVDLAEPAPADLAYVMFTSGSTGRPKGVMVEHGGLANYVAWAADRYAGGSPATFPLHSSFGFDLTVTSLFVPLVTGGAVVVYPETEGDPAILEVFADDAVDVVKLTPSHLAIVDDGLLRTQRIRALVLGGEDLKTAVAERAVRASGGRLEVHNEYGPTEATVGCMDRRFDPAIDTGSSVPLGAPAWNTRIHVLDVLGAPAPTGVVGEIHVAGAGVARGYAGRPDLTDAGFLPEPGGHGGRMYRTGDLARWTAPGVLEFLGRADDQVKIRGHRIELGDVEHALLSHPAIAAAHVDVLETRTGRTARTRDDDGCVRCGLTAAHPDSHLDDAGICAPCRFYDRHRADAEAYFGTLDEFRDEFAGVRRTEAGQDCVMLLSGGKDSTYALYQLVALGHRPLVFTLDNGFISDGAKANIRRAVDDLGLELVTGRTDAMNGIFADSLATFSNVCQGCFKTVYTLGLNLARDRGIDLVVTGLSRGQIFETRLADLFRIGITDRDEVDAAIVEARRAYHRVDDAVRRSLDTSLFDDDQAFESIRVVDYYRYHDVGLDDVLGFLAERAPWVRPADTGRSTNCLINDTGIWVHLAERGYHNYALPYSWDVRLGHKDRDAALAELDDEIDVDEVHQILDEVGYRLAPGAGRRGERTAQLVAYVAGSDLPPIADLRRHLADRLPDHMVPSHLVPLDALPLTTNGKVDRRSLPDPRRLRRAEHGAATAPRTPVEAALVAIWEGVLGLEEVGVHDPFVEIGGDSILNIQIVARARREGLAFTPQELFEAETIARLARVVRPVTDGPSDDSGPRHDEGLVVEADLDADDLDDLLRTFGGDR